MATTGKVVGVAALACALTTGGVLLGTGSSAAPESGRSTAARVHTGWPSSDMTVRQAVKQARATARVDGGSVLTVTERVLRTRSVDVGRAGASAGDFLLWEGALSRGGERVGRDSVRCTVAIHTFVCDATAQIAGRGKLTVYGAFFGEEAQLAVTGGTGDFHGASGGMSAVEGRGGTTTLVFHWVR